MSCLKSLLSFSLLFPTSVRFSRPSAELASARGRGRKVDRKRRREEKDFIRIRTRFSSHYDNENLGAPSSAWLHPNPFLRVSHITSTSLSPCVPSPFPPRVFPFLSLLSPFLRPLFSLAGAHPPSSLPYLPTWQLHSAAVTSEDIVM